MTTYKTKLIDKLVLIICVSLFSLIVASFMYWILAGMYPSGTFRCPAKRETTLISNGPFIHAAANFTLTLQPKDGQELKGEYIEIKDGTFFSRVEKRGALLPEMKFYRGWNDSTYILRIIPETETIAKIK